MKFQLLNARGNANKQSRFRKELEDYKTRLNELSLESHRILSNIKSLEDKKRLEQASKK